MLTTALLSVLCAPRMEAQTEERDWTASVEARATVSSGQTPLWLHANRYGMGSLRAANGYVRATSGGMLAGDKANHRWSLDACVDMALAWHLSSTCLLQQLYVEGHYRHLSLTVGQKQHRMELKNALLSSGSQTLGLNARPWPEVRLEVADYWDVPGTGRWLALKGHLAYGWATDADWQEDWTEGANRYVHGERLHTKAGYLRLGPDDSRHPYSLELGLEMACQFGGTLHHTSAGTLEAPSGLRAYWDAFTASGSDEVDATYHNVGGNQLGSWVARLNYDWPWLRLSLYADHYFEDHSSMLLTDYDGYGEGADWNTHSQSRYLIYPLRDMLWGVELQLHRTSWIKGVVLEYIDTRYQSGPIYHDHNEGISDHIGGDDNYYNHYLYQGWSHWGEVIGNPLYRSPLYNNDHTLTIESNRFRAVHVGMNGSLGIVSNQLSDVDYRLLCSWQRSLGTYQAPFVDPQDNLSLMAEVSCVFASDWLIGGSQSRVTVALGYDHGELLGNNAGVQVGWRLSL